MDNVIKRKHPTLTEDNFALHRALVRRQRIEQEERARRERGDGAVQAWAKRVAASVGRLFRQLRSAKPTVSTAGTVKQQPQHVLH